MVYSDIMDMIYFVYDYDFGYTNPSCLCTLFGMCIGRGEEVVVTRVGFQHDVTLLLPYLY